MKERFGVAARVTAFILVIVLFALLGREINAGSPLAPEPPEQAVEMSTETLID